MSTQVLPGGAAADSSCPKQGGTGAEALLLPRTGARSDSSHCTDGFRPVTFKLERVEDES